MLEFGIKKNTDKFVHVNSVPNGIKCGCICPECEDDLIAKNNCKDKSNHFAHVNLVEGRACLMTQLHLAAQNYFLNIAKFNLPKVLLTYDGRVLTAPSKTINITSSKLEAPFGKFRADVLLETDIGQIVIEISVTHESEKPKIKYYKENEIPSLEYDLARLKSLEVKSVVDLLSKNQAPSKWHYAWCEKQLIHDYIENKRLEELAELKRRRESAKKSARKYISSKSVLLPTINEIMKYSIGEIDYEEEVQVFTQKNIVVDEITIFSESNDHLILKCIKQSTLNAIHTLYIAYPYTVSLPEPLKSINGSVIVRQPSIAKGKRATWYWHKSPQLEEKRRSALELFKERCNENSKRQKSTELAEPYIISLSKEYAYGQDSYFKTGYGNWKQWLIKKGLFTPQKDKKNPSYPHILKYYKIHPNLWMFDEWYVLVISVIAEIVDNIPLNTRIVTSDIFKQTAMYFGLRSEFMTFEKEVSHRFLKVSSSSLIIRSAVISSVLDIFESEMKVNRDSSGYVRTGSLLESVRPK